MVHRETRMRVPLLPAILGPMRTFEELVEEGEAVPTAGWDFSWFAGRADEQRPPWGYARLLAERMAKAAAGLDIQTGGGEVLASIPIAPPLLAATESWPPNVEIARRTLAKFDATVVETEDAADLPFAEESFDLVVSRHPVVTRWDEVRRVLRPNGVYLAQQVGSGSVRELNEFMMGPQPLMSRPMPVTTTYAGTSPIAAVTAAEAVGLDVVDVRQEALRMEFHDIAAVVHFLRKVIWIVPGFTVDAYRDRLAELHSFIERHGPFVAYSQRFLIEAHWRR
jgi:SAM-dependent methyltransferase